MSNLDLKLLETHPMMWPLLKDVHFFAIPGLFKYLWKNGCLQKIKVISMKELKVFHILFSLRWAGMKAISWDHFVGCNILTQVPWAIKKNFIF